MAGTQKAIISLPRGQARQREYGPIHSRVRERVLGMPEISSDGFKPYLPAIRDAFGNRVAHAVVSKTYSVVYPRHQIGADSSE